MRAVIVGGGVAGPAVGLALHRAAIESVLLERRPDADPEAGSYLTVSTNGLHALGIIGAYHLVEEVGFRSRLNTMYGATGRALGEIPLGRPLDDGTVALTMKRSRLAVLLAEEAQRRGVEVRRDARVVSVAGGDGGVTATLEDGTTTSFGAHPTPEGDVVWFLNVPRAEISTEERRTTSLEQWQQSLLDLVREDVGPAAALVSQGELELAGDNTYDLPRVPTWSRDGMVVLGDAAHAPAPSSGQGASMALEDAVVLAQALRDGPDVTSALSAYEQVRRPRVGKIVAAGARSSSSKIPGPVGRRIQERVLGLVFRHLVTENSTAWMSGHRIEWDTPVG